MLMGIKEVTLWSTALRVLRVAARLLVYEDATRRRDIGR
jgi:hypothetical protein